MHLIYGNHDKDYQNTQTFQSLQDYKEIKTDLGKVVCFHYPIHVWHMKHYCSLHLHGHQHNTPEYNLKMRELGIYRYDVGVDANNYTPVLLDDIREFFKGSKIETSKCSYKDDEEF